MSHNYHMWFVSPNYHTTLYQIEKLLSIKFNKKKKRERKKKDFENTQTSITTQLVLLKRYR